MNLSKKEPTSSDSNKRRIGTRYERIAAEYLVSLGCRILEQSFHAGRFGEIDIIAEAPDGTIIFCECKYRSNEDTGTPFEAVDYRKQRRISHAAIYYYSRHGYTIYTPCRFDVIGIYGDGRLIHIPDAFPYRE